MSLLALTRLSMEPETGWPLLRHYPSVPFSSERTPVASIIAAAAGMPEPAPAVRTNVDRGSINCEYRRQRGPLMAEFPDAA